ncbi:MAG: hypothetical protein ACJ74H_06500 [Thermoanaerobaculia bacterium]
MQIRPLLFLSLFLTFPLGAALVVDREHGVTTPVIDVAAFSQTGAHLASDGDSYLAVWIDQTSLLGSGDVHGALIDSNGKRISDDVLPIAVTPDDEPQVAVAFGGDRYLVVWPTANMLHGRFVARDGSMSNVFDVAPMDLGSTQPQIAFNGSRFLVTWFNDAVFRGALLDTNGTVLKTFDIASRQQTSIDGPTVAANGMFHFISSITDFNGTPTENGYPGDVGVTPIDAEGNVGARTVVAPATTPVFDLRAVSSGNDFVIAWSTAIGIPGGTVRAVRVTPTGAGAVEIIPTEGMYLHDVGVDGGGFFVIYGADTAKFLRRLGTTNSTAVAVPPTQNAIVDVAGSLAIVRGKGRVGFEWGPAGADLYVTRLDTGDIEPLVVAPRHQEAPDVAAAGDLRLAVWTEYIGSERRTGIIGVRLSASGESLDPNGIDLHGSVYQPLGPRVASNGTDWLVIWVDSSNVYGVRVAHDGSLMDAVPMLIAAGIYRESEIAVSWDGTQYVVIYFKGQYLRGVRTTTRAARVPAQGPITAPELTLSAEGANELPSIASSPQGSLVVWRGGSFLNGGLLSPGGTFAPVAFPATASPSPRPSVAWNRGTFLVAAPFGEQVQWLLVSDTGVVRTPLSTFLDIATEIVIGYPSVEVEAYGEGFHVYWKGKGDDTVYAARINDQGVLTDGAKAVGTSLPGYAPSFGATGNMVVYARRIGRENARVFVREIEYVTGKPRRRAV